MLLLSSQDLHEWKTNNIYHLRWSYPVLEISWRLSQESLTRTLAPSWKGLVLLLNEIKITNWDRPTWKENRKKMVFIRLMCQSLLSSLTNTHKQTHSYIHVCHAASSFVLCVLKVAACIGLLCFCFVIISALLFFLLLYVWVRVHCHRSQPILVSILVPKQAGFVSFFSSKHCSLSCTQGWKWSMDDEPPFLFCWIENDNFFEKIILLAPWPFLALSVHCVCCCVWQPSLSINLRLLSWTTFVSNDYSVGNLS